MFTGIITDIGSILSLDQRGDMSLRIGTKFDTATIDYGASISCHGICLSVTQKGAGWFAVDVSNETVSRTNVGDWVLGSQINLERALRVGDELGGHIVSGHVDGVARVIGCEDIGGSTRVELEASEAFAKFIAPKGSLALNGVSLTVNQVEGARFNVNLIAHTKSVTTWAKVRPNDRINLEVDTIARYVTRLHECR